MTEPMGTTIQQLSADDERVLGERYRIGRQIGAGAHADVFLAEDLQEDRTVALKIMRETDAESRRRLIAEFDALASLRHRNLVTPHTLFADGDRVCYAMEYVAGTPWASAHTQLVSDAALLGDTLVQLADVVETIHANGRVHGDLSAGNVMLTSDARLVVLDIVGRGTGVHGRQGQGTPAYMAPELFTGALPSQASDWYAVGALVHECITGAPLFDQSDPVALLAAKQKPAAGPTPIDAFPLLAPAIARLLDPDATTRGDGRLLRSAIVRAAPPPVGGRDMPMIGRRRESATLRQKIGEAASQSRLQVVVVSGPSGIGKTRLLNALCDETSRDHLAFSVLGRAGSSNILPLRILASLLDDLSASTQQGLSRAIERCYPRHLAELRATFPAAAALFGSGEPTQCDPSSALTRELATRSAADVFARLSLQLPVLLCLDDLQQSDADSRDGLLRFLLDLSESPIVCVVARAPSANDAGTSGFIEECRANFGDLRVTELALAPMPREQLVAIAWQQLESWTGPADLVDAISSGARGNPGMCVWFARALLLASSELPRTREEYGALDGAVFDSVWQRLPDGARRLSSLLAISPGGLPRNVVRELMHDPVRADAALRELEHSGFSMPTGDNVSLWHDHIGDLVRAQLAPTERTALHLAIANAFLSSAPGQDGAAAHHFLAAGEQRSAAQSFARGATQARTDHAHHRAVELLSAALELHEADDDERRTLELALADSLHRLGRLRVAAELADRLSRRDELAADLRRRLQQRAIGAFGALAELERLESLLGEALGTRLDSKSPALLARLVALRLRIALRAPWRSSPRPSTAESEVESNLDALWIGGSRLLHLEPILAAYLFSRHMLSAFRVGSLQHQARALAFEAVLLTSSGDRRLTAASTLIAAAERKVQQSDDPSAQAAVHQGAGFMWGNVGRFREAIEEGRRCIEALQLVDDLPTYELSHARMELGWRLVMIGEYREVLALGTASLRDAVECGDPVSASAFHVQLANAHLAADRVRDANEHLEAAERGCPRRFEVGAFGIFIARLAQHLYLGDVEGALEHASRNAKAIESLRILDLPAVRTVYWYRVGAMLTHAIAEAGPTKAAALRRRCDRVRARLRRDTFDVAIAHARLLETDALAAAGAVDSALGHLREAIDRFAALGWHSLAAASNLRYCALQSLTSDGGAQVILTNAGVADATRWARTLLPKLEFPLQ